MVQCRALNASDQELVQIMTQMADQAFGQGYLDAAEIHTYLTGQNKGVIGAFDKQFLGWLLWQLQPTGLVLRTIVVDAEIRGSGTGGALINQLLNLFNDQPVTCIIWERNPATPLPGMLQRRGFELSRRIAGYWKNAPGAGTCPECGQINCQCTAAIYVLKR